MILPRFILYIIVGYCLTTFEKEKTTNYLLDHLSDAISDSIKKGRLINANGIPKFADKSAENPAK